MQYVIILFDGAMKPVVIGPFSSVGEASAWAERNGESTALTRRIHAPDTFND